MTFEIVLLSIGAIACFGFAIYAIIYNKRNPKFRQQYKELKSIISTDNPQNIQCPYCNSTNLKKISTTSKVANTALLGMAAMGKVNSNWHCNNCNSDF